MEDHHIPLWRAVDAGVSRWVVRPEVQSGLGEAWLALVAVHCHNYHWAVRNQRVMVAFQQAALLQTSVQLEWVLPEAVLHVA